MTENVKTNQIDEKTRIKKKTLNKEANNQESKKADEIINADILYLL